MTVSHDAFDELLDRAALAEEEGEATEQGDMRRRQFAAHVDRAVRNALARDDGRPWHTQTLKQFCCRLYFFRHLDRLYLVGCVALDDAEAAMP